MFDNIACALDWLYSQKKSKKREDLSRISCLVKSLNLKLDYRKVHVAGTNGKGSTVCMLKNILELQGLNVGIFISPFVICFNERIQINGIYISDELVIKYCNQLHTLALDYFNKTNDTIPFFELTFLMALLHFDCNNIDVAIIECGLGGRLDATNCLDTDLQIITNIGYDHMQTLGNSLEEIAYHKLGITIPGKKCLTCVDESLSLYFDEYSKANNIDMIYVNKNITNIISNKDYLSFNYQGINYQTCLNAYYQAYNASLAIEASKLLINDIDDELINKALLSSHWPGRFEYLSNNVIIDGAHNIHGISALVNAIKAKYNHKVKIVFTALHDKAIKEMISLLDEVSNFYYFTTIDDKRATEIEFFENLTSVDNILIKDYNEAILTAINELKETEILVITGSLHFISLARQYIKMVINNES